MVSKASVHPSTQPIFRLDTNKILSVKHDEELKSPTTLGETPNLDYQDLEIFVEGSNLVDLDFFSLSDPQCTLKTRDVHDKTGEWKFLGETEPIDNNLNPKWIKYFSLRYLEN